DPFSARTDTGMWTLECFDRVFAACGEHDTELFTYSASTSVRAALLAAGFVVGRGVPTGTKPETTLAMTPSAALRSVARGRELHVGAHTLVPRPIGLDGDVTADDGLLAVVTRDEAEALVVIEPLDRSCRTHRLLLLVFELPECAAARVLHHPHFPTTRLRGKP